MELIPIRGLYASIVVLFVFMGVFSITSQVTDLNIHVIIPKPSIQYFVHDVISINGNNEFRAMAVSESWQGDGSMSSPYVISGYNITSESDGSLIEIQYTNLSFQVVNCLLYGGGRGIFLKNVTNGQIINNNITRSQGRGIHIQTSDQNNVTDNLINMTGFWGLELDYSHQNFISANELFKTEYGIKLHYSDNNTLKGNKITETKSEEDFYGGISLFQSNYNTLSSNNISNTLLDGVKLKSSSYCDLTGNFIHNNSRRGILLEGSSNNSLRDNTIINSYLDGIFLQKSKSNSLTKNNISGNHECGILLDESERNIFRKNLVFFNLDHGISLQYSQKCELNDNNVSENQRDGITLQDSDSCILFDNNITNNNNYGISDLIKSEGIIITGNFLSQNRNYSIYLYGSEDVQIEWNSFIENNLIEGTSQAYDLSGGGSFNYNYWNELTGPDNNNDGIVDISYEIDGYVPNHDSNPLIDYVPPHQLIKPIILAPVKDRIVSKEINIRWTTGEDSRRTHVINYSVYYSTDRKEWFLIVEGLLTTHYLWNTTALEDGSSYQIKIVASCLFGVSSEAISEVFTVNNEYNPPFPVEILFLLVSGITLTLGFIIWKGKSLLFQPKLESPSFVICLGSLTDEGLTIQEKSEDCPFDDQELLSMIEYSAVLYQHGEIGNIYGPFPQTSITRSTDMEWHYLSFAFHVKDESAEDTRVVKKGGVTPAILLLFYEKGFDATISSKKDKIRDYLISVDLEDISKGTKDWIAQISKGVQEKVSTKE